MNNNTKYSKELLEEAVQHSESIAGVLRYLGVRQSGGNHSHISRRIKEFGLDTKHFTGQAHNRGLTAKNRLRPEEVLVLRESGSRTEAKKLRRSLIEIGVEEECVICGIGKEYNGRPLTLEIDHINQNWLDNRLGNLRFLCPNCHAQETSEFIQKKVSRNESRKINICLDCSTQICRGSLRCVACKSNTASQKTKIDWPPRSEVQSMVESLGYSATGRSLGVSATAVRKYLQKKT